MYFHSRTLILTGALMLLAAAHRSVSAQTPGTPGRDLAGVLAAAQREGVEVGVYYRSADGADSVLVAPDLRMHAASTMKVPVMLQLYLDQEAGRLDLDAPVQVRTTFASILDGSSYELDRTSDSEQELYDRAGQDISRRDLIERMITRSSNLATNLLIDDADAQRVTATMRSLGADSIEVLRGVEDIPAYEAGLSNTTTARDMGVIMRALVEGGIASERSRAEMIGVLERQQFVARIPAGVPSGVRVANKTGSITAIHHDAAIIFPGNHPPYVLVVLIRGWAEQTEKAAALASGISRRIWDRHVTAHDGTGPARTPR